MSQRFYVNKFQPFGNGEMFENTKKECERQGCKWSEDGMILKKTEIKDPQALLEAITIDSLNQVKEYLSRRCKDKDFSEITDVDILKSEILPMYLKNLCFTKTGEPIASAYNCQNWFIEDKRIFAPMMTFQAIQDCLVFNRETDRYEVKKGKHVWVRMY